MSKEPVLKQLYDAVMATQASDILHGCTQDSVSTVLWDVCSRVWFADPGNAFPWDQLAEEMHCALESPKAMLTNRVYPQLEPKLNLGSPGMLSREARVAMADAVVIAMPAVYVAFRSAVVCNKIDCNIGTPPLRAALFTWLARMEATKPGGWPTLVEEAIAWLQALPAAQLEQRLEEGLRLTEQMYPTEGGRTLIHYLRSTLTDKPLVEAPFDVLASKLFRHLATTLQDINSVAGADGPLNAIRLASSAGLGSVTPLRDEFVRLRGEVPEKLEFMMLDVSDTLSFWLCRGDPERVEQFLGDIVTKGARKKEDMFDEFLIALNHHIREGYKGRAWRNELRVMELDPVLVRSLQGTFAFAVGKPVK